MKVHANKPGLLPPAAEPNQRPPSLSRARVNGARAVVVDDSHNQRMYRALSERALGPAQAKPAVYAKYGDLIAATRAPVMAEKDEQARTRGTSGQRPTQPIEANAADPFGYGDLSASARTTAPRGLDATAMPAPARAKTDFLYPAAAPMERPWDASRIRADQYSARPLALQRKCAPCAEEEQRELQREAAPGEQDTPRQVPEVVGDVLGSGGGRPLDPALRRSFELRFGRDFSGVRIHDGARADASTRAVSATAYTVGNDVVFRRGAYDPNTTRGRKLLAHELTHVAQQSGGEWHAAKKSDKASFDISQPGDAAEREADRVAEAVVREGSETESVPSIGVRNSASSISLQRQTVCDDDGACHEEEEASPAGDTSTSGFVGSLLGMLTPALAMAASPAPNLWPTPGPGESGVFPKGTVPGGNPTPRGAPMSGLGRWLGPVGAFLDILLTPSKLAPPWMSEMNPTTGKPYASQEEYEEVHRLPPDEIKRRQEEVRRGANQNPTPGGGAGQSTAPTAGQTPSPSMDAATAPQPNKEEEKKEKCSEKKPNRILCNDPLLGAHVFGSENGAFNAIKMKKGEGLRKEQQGADANSGPCVGRGGWHTRVKQRGSYIASIVCCPCCDDSSGKAVERSKCKIHWH
ncbi:eCIS core domain-containing protein [Sorangium sp. So ce861]|uniref:eCIS core domain-containing protein n=1 Tax=Sorangium sp. So ce861 TaxID=3133323 RepID=UPI003F5F5309